MYVSVCVYIDVLCKKDEGILIGRTMAVIKDRWRD